MLAEQSQVTNTRQQESSRRVARAQRILDAAAELILRWGYQKTTLDDISRQAGVAKATIYLHWKTREELFAALLKREKLEMAEELKQRIAEDPEGATLRGMLKHSALLLMKRPLLKAVMLRDMEVIGKLAQSEHSTAAYAERLEGFKTYLELLREQGLVRTNLSTRAQGFIMSAVFLGFFYVAPFMPEEYTISEDEFVELIAETVHCTLEPADGFSVDALQTASHNFLRYLDHTTTLMQEQFQQELASWGRDKSGPNRGKGRTHHEY